MNKKNEFKTFSAVAFDDTTYNHWVKNTKLPSERWLEDIEINFEVTVAKAIVL